MSRQAKTVIHVHSANFDNVYMTFEAYSELRLIMSTGDFAVHRHEVVNVPNETFVLSLGHITGDCYEPE